MHSITTGDVQQPHRQKNAGRYKWLQNDAGFTRQFGTKDSQDNR